MKFIQFALLSLTALFTALPCHAQTSFAPLAEKLMPSVVNISSQQQDTEDEPGVVNDLLFSAPDGRVALGSGFIVSADGYIVTNRHVIEKASKISVIGFDNQEYEAQVIGDDIKTDVAVIKIMPQKPLLPVEFGDSDKIKVGDWILAIGNPFGLGSSVTAGIISAKSRDIDSGPYDNYLQTDASINQGNSGGPMFDMDGRLIGINTAIFSSSGNSVGIGFALPVNQARWVVEQLRQNGKVERAWLGIAVKPIKVSDNLSGLVVTAFEDENIGLGNGLQLGDVILQLNGVPAISAKEFSLQVAQMAPETEVQLQLWRNGEIISQKARTGRMIEPEHEIEMPDPQSVSPRLNVENKTMESESATAGKFYPQLRLTLNGLTVVKVEEGSEAALKGVKSGDAIVKAGNLNITSPEDLHFHMQEAVLSATPLRLDFQDGETGEGYFVEIPFSKTVPVMETQP